MHWFPIRFYIVIDDFPDQRSPSSQRFRNSYQENQNPRLALREDFPPSRHTYISQLAIAFLAAIRNPARSSQNLQLKLREDLLPIRNLQVLPPGRAIAHFSEQD
ncbi:hypothetical protein [Coleofasciculus sp. FACHB-1120]|uniref:hypothetical protein n=1 Tax=Coleofasciculus sp. FACHB-1120 TaxID=2692783 RepID=UPI001683C9B4|nr:hypothetical protein [Coleofasciculus sp. FACHB-1120]MBD2744722.1 hypothetical protein [Coleofasciculus sp. FACHB-1120]